MRRGEAARGRRAVRGEKEGEAAREPHLPEGVTESPPASCPGSSSASRGQQQPPQLGASTARCPPRLKQVSSGDAAAVVR